MVILVVLNWIWSGDLGGFAGFGEVILLDLGGDLGDLRGQLCHVTDCQDSKSRL